MQAIRRLKSKRGWLIFSVLLLLTLSLLFWEEEPKPMTELADSPLKEIPVSVERVQEGTIAQWVLGEGTLQSVKSRCLAFEVTGRVKALGKDPLGNDIREGLSVLGPQTNEQKGQLLAELENQDYYQTLQSNEAAYRRSEASLEVAHVEHKQTQTELKLKNTIFARKTNLYKKRVVPQSEVEQINTERELAQLAVESAKARIEIAKAQVQATKVQWEQAQRNYERTKLYAPWNGVLAVLNINVGDQMAPQTETRLNNHGDRSGCPIAMIDPSLLEVSLEIPWEEGRPLQEGMVAQIRSFYAHPGGIQEIEWFPATIYSIAPVLSAKTRTLKVRLRTLEAVQDLRDGELVAVKIKAIEHQKALLVPERALLYQANRPYLFTVDQHQNTVTKQFVTLGTRENHQYEVIQGIEREDLVVTDGRHQLRDGVSVKIVTSVTLTKDLADNSKEIR